MAFQAKIRMNKSGPLTHTGRGGRTVKKGQSFTTSDPAEARYYQTIAGFNVQIVKGKLAAKPPQPDPSDVDDDDDDDDDTGEDEDRDEEVGDVYDVADLKKLKASDLRDLIKDDDELPLSLKDVKGMQKKAIIAAIMEAQGGDEDEDDEDEED